MRPVYQNYEARNEYTSPLEGKPYYRNSGVIYALDRGGSKYAVSRIDFEQYDEQNFQYIFSPEWSVIDSLPTSIFQGIPGLDMSLRLEQYYRVNMTPYFISERTPSEGREDLWELLEEVGLDYYDRFEWLLRTDMRAANDNLIVERRRLQETAEQFAPDVISGLQYGDKVIVESLEAIADTTAGFADVIFSIVTSGVDVITKSGQVLIDAATRAAMIPYVITQRIISRRERKANRQKGIEKAKKDGKYTGRQPIVVDETALRQAAKELDEGIITVEEAMRRIKINSRSTFYRKLKKLQ